MAVGVREEDQLDDATRAFEDLRAEVMVLRRAVEALGPALKENRAPDYSLTLGQIAKAQATVCEHLAAMEDHPALRLTPAAFGEQVERAVAEASRKTLRDAEGAARAISGASQDVQAMLGYARTREAQNWRLLQAAAIGVVAGLTLFPLLGFPIARILPFGSLPDRLAAAALGEDGWSAGSGLMQRASPAEWRAINESLLRSEAAGDELKTCYEAAKKTGKEQRCNVVMKAPPPR
jgi:hypothetical protein